jgi:predicted DNA-binding transcriptional regulator AlpA
MAASTQHLPETGWVREYQIVGDKKKGYPKLTPFGRTTFRKLIKSGSAPAPTKISKNIVAWRVEDIRAWLNELGGAA